MALTTAERQARYAEKHDATLLEVADLIDAILAAVDRGGACREVRDSLRKIDPAMDVRAAARDLKALLDTQRLIVCCREDLQDG